ncbi:hypothetical protein AH67_07585 [Bifidobacterium pseudolongum PV8-2]|uniref:Uncharacterized protein n=1 Tax=Bifidobacterium pseudolongum PV8-2 TaxID=1447715 RepID=A0A0A7IA22_9BIFI|nr:hypothetical protein AH67_07585 [Bifidobacterium pseudolongum PV8-2]
MSSKGDFKGLQPSIGQGASQQITMLQNEIRVHLVIVNAHEIISDFFIKTVFQHLSRYASNYRIWRYIITHHGTRTYHAPLP